MRRAEIKCPSCGCMVVVGKTCACGHFATDRCDAYVYDKERRWYWKCHHCDREAGPFRRRMDADESSETHGRESSAKLPTFPALQTPGAHHNTTGAP